MEVAAANLLNDPLDLAEECRTFKCKSHKRIELRHFKSSDLTRRLTLWALDLTEANMRILYNTCSWGWNRREKKREMLEEKSRYLIAFLDENPVAFAHFRFDMDFERQVIYCYEIQLDVAIRSLHLGSHLMRTLEVFAHKTKIPMVVLTSLKNNPSATKFFKKLGYKYDETNLKDIHLDHVILSKQVP